VVSESIPALRVGQVWALRAAVVREMRIVHLFRDGDALLANGHGQVVRSPRALHSGWTLVRPDLPLAPDPALHPTGACACAGDGTCDWCQTICPTCGGTGTVVTKEPTHG